MKAMVIDRIGPVEAARPALRLADVPDPSPGPGDVRIRVRVCGVCRTEIDEIEGRTPPAALPRVPGHQVVGDIDAVGDGVDAGWRGARVGVAWIFDACGRCEWCRTGRENLCPDFVATGRDVDGGYAELMIAPAAFVHRLPDGIADDGAAPLLCAGAIGHRSLNLAALTDGAPLGLTGFGASGHLVLSMARARYPRSPVFVFARNAEERALARDLGAAWTGDAADAPPAPLAAIIDTTPAWTPVVRALEHLAPGGRLVVNAIRKESADQGALLDVEYSRHLWMEKSIQSVANVTRADVRECLDLAARHGIRPDVTAYPLARANDALVAIRRGAGRGARVLRIN
jgi:propanol-preferring alcohol dehydrogenase